MSRQKLRKYAKILEKSGKSKKWDWNINLSFDFGKNRRLEASTKINKKELSVQFTGDSYFQRKLRPVNLSKLANSLEEKIGLKINVSFNVYIEKKPPGQEDGLHLEV